MKVVFLGAQGTHILETPDCTHQRVHEKNAIQPGAPLLESSNNFPFCPMGLEALFIYRVRGTLERGQMSSVETRQISQQQTFVLFPQKT